MITSKNNRFSDYYLDDFEINILKVNCNITYNEPITNILKSELGVLYLNNLSLIFESFNDSIPIIKLKLKKITNFDDFILNSENKIEIIVSEIIEIDTSPPLKPHIIHSLSNSIIRLTVDFEKSTITSSLFNKLLTKIKDLYKKECNLTLTENSDFINPLKILAKEMYDVKVSNGFNPKNSITTINEITKLQNIEIVFRVQQMLYSPYLLFLTNKAIYYEKLQINNLSQKLKPIFYYNILKVFKRRYMYQQDSIEIYVKDIDSKKELFYFEFENEEIRDNVYNIIVKEAKNIKEVYNIDNIEKYTADWRDFKISNRKYIKILNLLAGRSFSDLSQYPIYPVILNLKGIKAKDYGYIDDGCFRDFSLPIGMQNSEIFESRIKNYNNQVAELGSNIEGMHKPFIFGSHYSTPSYVAYYLLREKPWLAMRLQSGKFDKPDRMFRSISTEYKSIIQGLNFKELIPEFYGKSNKFLENNNNLNLGLRQNKKKIGNVKYPKWAADSSHYLDKHKELLESEYVSNHINEWIDMIFGYKQKGIEAEKIGNIFHPFCYDFNINLNNLKSTLEKKAAIIQINEFGQVPIQLFKTPHLKRGTKISHTKDNNYVSINNDDINNDIEKKIVNINFTFAMEKDLKLGITVLDIHINSSNDTILICCSDGVLRIINVLSFEIEKSFIISKLALTCIKPIGSSNYVISSYDGFFYIFNEEYGYNIFTQKVHYDIITDVKIVKDNDALKIFTSSKDCTIKITTIKFNKIYELLSERYILDDHDYYIYNVDVLKDKQLLYCIDEDYTVLFYNLDNYSFCRKIKFGQDVIYIKSISNGFIITLFSDHFVILNSDFDESFSMKLEEIRGNTWTKIKVYNKNNILIIGSKGIIIYFDFETKLVYKKNDNNFHNTVHITKIDKNNKYFVAISNTGYIYKCINK